MASSENKRHIPLLAVLGLTLALIIAGGIFFSFYFNKQIHEERKSQIVEITSQLQNNLDSGLNSNWNYLSLFVNMIDGREFTSVKQVTDYLGRMEGYFIDSVNNSYKLGLIDSNGNGYDPSGFLGLWSDADVIKSGEDRYTIISNSDIYKGDYWKFVKKLSSPLHISGTDITFIYAVLVKDVESLKKYYDVSAFNGRNEAYILKLDGTMLSSGLEDSNRMIKDHDVLNALETMEGQNHTDILSDLKEHDPLSSDFYYNGEHYYYGITTLKNHNSLLLYHVPAEYVATATVKMVNTVVRTLLMLAALILLLMVFAVVAVLRHRNTQRMAIKEHESLMRQEEMNEALKESNVMLAESRLATEEALQIAEGANKAKSAFLSNMSHDIRTPMNAIIGFATLLARDAENPEKVRDYTKKITASGQHLLGLINDILDISKIEAGKTTLNLSDEAIVDLIEGIDSIIRPQMKSKGHTFEIHSKDIKHEHLVMDKLRLNQILLNLLSNAYKYTPEGGHITLTIQELPQQSKQLARFRFIVADNGYGMTEDYLSNIFQPFTREEDSTTKKIQGTGLGMAITKNLVDLMGGTIKVTSTKGKGSTFTIDLTLYISAQGIDHTFWKDHNITKMLVVDDEEVICRNVILAMEETGVNVEYALDGRHAIEMAQHLKDSGEAQYDAFLLDWKMPGLDGIETARSLRKIIDNDTPVMILTSYDWPDAVEYASEAGVDGFLNKPFFITSFRQKIDELLNKETADPNDENKEEESILRGMNILVAEDNEINAEILSELLNFVGATCDICENGQIAAETFENSEPGQYQLILMDVQMPVMNGYEATKKIRAMDHPMAASIPIIAMTANAFAEDIKDALDAGMSAHASKPVDMSVLEQTVKDVLEGKTIDG